MNETLSNAQSLNQTMETDFGWVANPYAYGNVDLASTNPSALLGPIDDVSSNHSFADAISAFTYQEPANLKHGSAATTTIDPMSMWPGPDPSTSPSVASRHDSAYSSSGTPKTAQTELTTYSTPDNPKPAQVESPASPLEVEEPELVPTESDSTTRARYAANQRHRKARDLKQASSKTNPSTTDSTKSTNNPNPTPTNKADEKKLLLREKNKVAAAKCRQRHRRQAETIRTKGARLSEDNAQLKSYVQKLRWELNALRAYALGHGECDARLAAYNRAQADRVLTEYYSSCGGGVGGSKGSVGGGGVIGGMAMPLDLGPKDEPQP